MDNEVQIFSNSTFGEVRTIVAEDGEPRFCLADVCKSLDLRAKKVSERLSKDALSKYPLPTAGGNQEFLFVNEDGLYDTILDSRKPAAKQFRKWITSEVIPSIRRTGGYIVASPDDTEEEIMARALQVANATLQRQKERLAQLEAQSQEQNARIERQDETITRQNAEIQKAAPKVRYCDEVLQSSNTLTTTQLAKELGMTDANRLNWKLAEIRLVYRQSGQVLLYAPYCNWGLHATRTQTYTRSDGSTGISVYTVWTAKGKMFLHALRDNDWNIKKAIATMRGEQATA